MRWNKSEILIKVFITGLCKKVENLVATYAMCRYKANYLFTQPYLKSFKV